MWKPLALVLLITLVAGCSAPTATPAVPPASASAPPSSPTTPPSSPVAPPQATPTIAPTAWAVVFSRSRAALRDLVADGPGLIAAGCVSDTYGNCVKGLLLTSPDGASWSRVDLEGAADAMIWSVKRVGDRLFALGERIDDQRGEVRATVWTSRDGRSWSRITAPSFRNRGVTDVIGSPVGTIAIGFDAPYASEGHGFVVWDVGPDGSFGEARDVHPTGGPYLVYGAAWTGDRFLAWGPGVRNNVRSTVLLTSSDGETWSVLPAVGAFRASTVLQILAVGDRLVAVGDKGLSASSPRAWTSADGGPWTIDEVPPGQGAMYTVRLEAGQLFARGREPWGTTDRPLTWRSSDGNLWTRLPDDQDLPALPGFTATSPATVDARICVAGTFSDDPVARASIYCR